MLPYVFKVRHILKKSLTSLSTECNFFFYFCYLVSHDHLIGTKYNKWCSYWSIKIITATI